MIAFSCEKFKVIDDDRYFYLKENPEPSFFTKPTSTDDTCKFKDLVEFGREIIKVRGE